MPGIPPARTFPRLYAILDVDVAAAQGVSPEALCDEWLAAGVRLIQLRAKTMSLGPMLALAERLAASCAGAGAAFVVNDRADVARFAGNAGVTGVHVGQDDLSPEEVRRIAPALELVGLSTHTEAQLTAALTQPVDYVATGPVFPTSTKARPDDVVGLDGVRRAALLVRGRGTPLVAIGGITLDRAAEVISAGADSVAVIAGLFAPGTSPRTRAEAWLDRLAQVTPPARGW